MGKQFRYPFRGKVDLPSGYNAKVGKRGLTIAESLLFGESATGVNMIAADGWRASYVNPPASFNPVGAPETITVTRQGFDATGTATTVNDTLTVMKRVRQAFPTQASLNQSDVALSDYVHFGDTISGGIYNASARVAPTPVCMWLDHDLQRAIGQSYTAKLAVSHMFARSGRPVAAVKFIATDGTTTVEQTVSAMSKADYTATGLSVPHFAATLNLATLTANALITIDAIVYPWVGAAYRASINGSAYPSINFTTLRVLNDNGSYGTAYAYCSPTGNDATGVTSATPSVAQALPYLTVAAAAAAIKVFNNANYSRNNTSGGIVRLEAGTFTHADMSASTSGNIPLVIEAANPANKATTIYQDAGVSTGGGTPNAVKFRDIKVKRNASGSIIFLDNGGASSSVVFENCTLDANGFGASWGAYIYQVAYVYVINCDGDDLGFGTAFSTDKKGINAIGSANSLGTATYNAAGCKSLNVALSDGSFGVGSREQTIGRFLGFNFFAGSGDPIITHFSQIGPAGFSLVGTVLEYRSGIGPIAQISESTTADQNMILHGCTFVGQRLNFAYNDTSGAPKLASVKYCVFDEYNTKGDVFASNGSYTGNWPVLYKVGARANALLYGDSNSDTFGVGQWAGEVAALGETIGTNATPIVANWTLDASSRGTAAGNGNYTPGASTALPFIPTGLAPYAFDLYGNPVSNTGTSRVGARQAVSSGVSATANGVTLNYAVSLVAGPVSASSQASGQILSTSRSLIAGAPQASSQASGAILTSTQSLIAGSAIAASQSSGVTLTETFSFTPGSASGGGAMDATANGVTLAYSAALIAGNASAASQAAGAILTETLSLIAGAAQAASQAQGATLTTTLALIAGAAQATSQAAGQTLAVTYSLIPGVASGNLSATANGATLSYAYALLAGIASGDVVAPPFRRGEDGGYGARERFWAAKAEEWLEAKLEQLPRIAKKPKAKRATAIETYEDDAAEYLIEFPEYAPRINAVTALMESLAQPYTDYAALMHAIEAQQAQIEAQRHARRRARDIEAILLLDA